VREAEVQSKRHPAPDDVRLLSAMSGVDAEARSLDARARRQVGETSNAATNSGRQSVAE
jgi:hypothetical protein